MSIFTKNVRETKKTKDVSASVTKELKKSAENACIKTKENFIKEHGTAQEAMEPRFRKEIHFKNLEVLDYDAYKARFPGHPMAVIGNHSVEDGKSYLREVESDKVRQAAVHETIHDLSYGEIRKNNDITAVNTGLREYKYQILPDGRKKILEDRARAFNEGYTQLLTGRELKRQGDSEAFTSFRPYSETKRQAAQLESIVGKEKMERAYYLGEKKELVHEFNRLNKSECAWDNFCDDTEIYANNPPSSFRAAAGTRINETFARMQEAKTQETR